MAKIHCEGKVQKCLCTNMRSLNMKNYWDQEMTPSCKAGILVGLQEWALLPDYQTSKNDGRGCSSEGRVVCMKDYIEV